MVFTIKQLNQFDYSEYEGIILYLDTKFGQNPDKIVLESRENKKSFFIG